ncbi:MAG: SGNH/GDSL hydrolase family protein [Acidimicrobiia bacterium]
MRGLAASAVLGVGLAALGWRPVAPAIAWPLAVALGLVLGWRVTGDLPLGVVAALWVGLLAVAIVRAGKVRVIVANLAILIAGLGLVDGVAWLASRGSDAVVPEAYVGAPYWSEAFRLERKEFSDRVETGAGTVERTIAGAAVRVNADYVGRYINVVDGRRRTVGSPLTGPRILIFGGSTVLDAEVPDDYTIASQLQSLVGDRWRVENYGVSGASLAGNLAWLRVLDLRPEDVVVTLSGVNNVGGVVDRGARWPALYETLDASRFDAARRRSWLIARLHAIANTPVYERDDAAVGEAVTRYVADLDAVAEVARSAGARYVNFLQPHLWTASEAARSAGERALTESWGPTFRIVVTEGYQRMADLATRRSDTADLRDAFDGKRRAIFFDWHHVNEHGNEMLARAIQAELERRGWLRGG